MRISNNKEVAALVGGLGASTAVGTGAAVLFGSSVPAGIICGGLFLPVAVLSFLSLDHNYPTEDPCRKVMYVVLALLAGIAAGFALSALLGVSITVVEAARIDLAIVAVVGGTVLGWIACKAGW
jgi:hypothetical protein